VLASLLPQARIFHAVVKITVFVVAPVCRKRFRRASSAKHSECQDEIDNLSAPVHSGAEYVVVLEEPVCAVSAQPELRQKTNKVVHKEAGMGAMRQEIHSTADDGEIQVVETEAWGVSVSDPKGKRRCNPYQEAQ